MNNLEMEEFVNAVREHSDIYEVVSRYVPLTLKSGRFWACCPFHEEKTPSFTVSPDKGIFYCFGCHEGGNVFKFISLMEHITYFEAVKLQAERLGIKLPSRKKTSEEIKFENEKKALLKITTLARDFYHNCLIKSKDGEQGRKYLAARGITENVIQDFKLGFAPDSWDALTKKLKAQGFSENQLVSAGLAIEKKSGVYDRFRNRVIIPISEITGKAVAFGGRILVDAEDQPKYLNSPETEIFSKGKLLFGLDRAGREIINTNTAIIVEGYMDAISIYSAGFKNVVASLGTAFTEEHAKILSRHARRIIFCYDNDDAGQRATVRALPIMRNTGAEVFILIVPDGKDPDEFIRNHGKDAFKKLLDNVTPFIDFQFQYQLNHINYSTLRGKMQVLKEILPLCNEIKDTVIQREYLKKFSSKLLLDEDIVFEEWRKISGRPPNIKKFAPKNLPKFKTSIISQAGCSIIKTIWREPELLNYVNALAPIENFTEIHREIINYIERCYNEGRTPDALNSARELSPAANLEISRIFGKDNLNDTEMLAFQDSIKVMRRADLERRYKQIEREIKEFSRVGDIETSNEKIKNLIEIKKEITEL